MFAFLSGELVTLYPTLALVDIGGVGYELQIPLSTYDKLPRPPAKVKLFTHLVIREDTHTLFGFATQEERDLFRLLIQSVDGVGPKIALAILSGADVGMFRKYVLGKDVVSLSRIKGVGKKTAEKIILELRDKLGVVEAWETSESMQNSELQSVFNDAVLGLIALGYKRSEAAKAVQSVVNTTGDSKLGPAELIREALKLL